MPSPFARTRRAARTSGKSSSAAATSHSRPVAASVCARSADARRWTHRCAPGTLRAARSSAPAAGLCRKRRASSLAPSIRSNGPSSGCADVADAVAVEVEAAVAAPAIADARRSLQRVRAVARRSRRRRSSCARIRCRRTCCARRWRTAARRCRSRETVVDEPVARRSVEQQPARVAGESVVRDGRVVAILQRQADGR